MSLRVTLAAAAAFLCVGAAAQAAVIPSLTGVTTNPTDFTFSYQGTLSGDAGLTTGSKLIIFDFAGYVANSIFSPFATVTTSTELTSATPITIPGTVDDPTLTNLVFTYNGPNFQTSGGPFAPVEFNGIGARSIFNQLAADTFVAITVRNNPDGTPGGTGTLIYDQGFITVPAPRVTPVGSVPEPGAWAMMIIGFGGTGALLRRRRMVAQAT